MVIAIIALLAAITFPMLARAKDAAKGSVCISNCAQVAASLQLYLDEFDGAYPQTRKTSANPAFDDAAGALEEPDFGSTFDRLLVYLKTRDVLACASDIDSRGRTCDTSDPDHAEVDSYVFNGYFSFGLKESSVAKPSETIVVSERRSEGAADVPPYCLYVYRPWFNPTNAQAPENDMDPVLGAIATTRHNGQSTYLFADAHAKRLSFTATYSAAGNVNLHKP